jgi:hypothetical protein
MKPYNRAAAVLAQRRRNPLGLPGAVPMLNRVIPNFFGFSGH